MKTHKLLILVLITMLLLAACGGDDDGYKSISVEDPALGKITVTYPGDWFAKGDGGYVIFANNEDVFDIEYPESGMAEGLSSAFSADMAVFTRSEMILLSRSAASSGEHLTNRNCTTLSSLGLFFDAFPGITFPAFQAGA